MENVVTGKNVDEHQVYSGDVGVSVAGVDDLSWGATRVCKSLDWTQGIAPDLSGSSAK